MNSRIETRQPVARTEREMKATDIDAIVEAGYDQALDLVNNFQIQEPRDYPPPTKNEVKRILAEKIDDTQLEKIAQMEQPQVLLMPVTSYTRYIGSSRDVTREYYPKSGSSISTLARQAIQRDGLTMPDTTKSPIYIGDNPWSEVPIISWQVAICETGMSSQISGDNMEASFAERQANFEEQYGQHGFQGVDFRQSILLIKLLQARNQDLPAPVLLNGEPLHKGMLKYVADDSLHDFTVLASYDSQRNTMLHRTINFESVKPSHILPSLVVEEPQAAAISRSAA